MSRVVCISDAYLSKDAHEYSKFSQNHNEPFLLKTTVPKVLLKGDLSATK